MRLAVWLIVAIGCGHGGDDGGRPPGWKPRPRSQLGADAGVADAGPGLPGTGDLAGGVPGSGGIIADTAPAPLACLDPIAGVWIAKTYADRVGRWHEHRLTITRQGSDYDAKQTTRMWYGPADASMPPACPGGGPDWGVVEMDDDLEWREGVLRVWGTAITGRHATCGTTIPEYNLDSFTGRLKRNTFDAANNDGHDAVNRPYRFRRVACGD